MINQIAIQDLSQPLGDVLLSAVDKLVMHFEGKETTIAFILFGGSAAEGFAVSTSDIDLVLVVEGVKTSRSVQFIINNRRIEVVVKDIKEFQDTITMPSSNCAGPTFFRQLDSRRRLLFAKPIYGIENYIKGMKDAKIKEFIVDLNAFQRSGILKSYADVLGALESNLHEDDLRVRSRLYLESSVDVLLTSMEDYYFRDKWRLSRIRRSLKFTPMNLIVEPISAMISGRVLFNNLEMNMNFWLEKIFFYSALCQYLSIFNKEHHEYIIFENLTNFSSLHLPLLITWQETMILIRSSKATLMLNPILANIVCLIAFNITTDRLKELVLNCNSYNLNEGSVDKLILEASSKALQLGIIKS